MIRQHDATVSGSVLVPLDDADLGKRLSPGAWVTTRWTGGCGIVIAISDDGLLQTVLWSEHPWMSGDAGSSFNPHAVALSLPNPGIELSLSIPNPLSLLHLINASARIPA